MNANQFIEEITGKEFRFNRTCLATGRVTDNEQITPREPVYHDRGGSIVLRSVHCYSDHDCMFTHDYGVYVAVVKVGAGHIWVDRFEPTGSPQFPFSPLVEATN